MSMATEGSNRILKKTRSSESLFETFGFQDCRGGRRGKKRDQCSASVSLICASNNARRELSVVLDFRWKRANKFDARLSQDFADLIESDLNVAAGNAFVKHFCGRGELGFGFHLCRDAQSLQQFGHVDTAGTATGRVRIRNRSCSQH